MSVTEATPVVILESELVGREAEGIKCPLCKGYADKVDCTKEEIESKLNCNKQWACCVAAFVCCLCGTRLVVGRAAPDAASA